MQGPACAVVVLFRVCALIDPPRPCAGLLLRGLHHHAANKGHRCLVNNEHRRIEDEGTIVLRAIRIAKYKRNRKSKSNNN